jgi:predicted glutamine amidotransferase
MCLIVVKPAGIDLPQDEYLREGAKRNSDGLGLAYLKNGENIVHIKKDFHLAQDLIDFIHTNITKDDNLIVHFRQATHGLKDEGNRHPFPICRNKDLLRKTEVDSKYIMAHNGVLSQYSRLDETELSDSQRFILEILSETAVKENLDKPGIKALISDFLNGDRLAILNNKGRIWMFGTFAEEAGCHYSSSGYKPYVYKEDYIKNWRQSLENNHWSSYYNNLNNTTPRTRQNLSHLTDLENKSNSATSTQNIHGKCEGCQKQKAVKFQSYKGEEYLLCKRCRKRARKNSLILTFADKNTIITPTETNDIKEFPCVSCREYFPAEKLTLLWDAYSVCEACIEIVKKDQNKPLLFQ